MSPSGFSASWNNVNDWIQSSVGLINSAWVNNSDGVRPVINLKSDVKITSGIGTANDPFIVETN